MTYHDLIQAAARIPEFDVDELLEPRQAARAWVVLEQCRVALECARDAIAKRPGVPTEFTREYFDQHSPALQNMRMLARAFQLESRLAAGKGDAEAAVRSGLDLVHLAHCQRRNGLNVDMLVACAIWATGITCLVEVRGHLNAERRSQLARHLIESEAEIEPTTTITARDAVWSATVEYPPLNEEQLRQDMANDMPAEEVESMLAMVSEMVSTPLVGSQQLYFNTSDRGLAYQRLLVVELAISNFIDRHQHPPHSLDELVPEFLLTRLPDPFTNLDFVYRIERGRHVLYSIGEKRHDLGGVRGSWAEAATGAADMFLE